MGCHGGCLCDACCAKARDFAFGHFGLDSLVSRSGYWHGLDNPTLNPRPILFENEPEEPDELEEAA